MPTTSADEGERDGRFYGRAALGHEWARDATFRDRSCNPGSRVTYFGCVAGSDGKRIGAYGDFGKSWAGELAVGIRTFWWTPAAPAADTGTLHFGTGAGITWGSDPLAEWQETELKARRLVALASGETTHADRGRLLP